jgi:hypothetical protein
MKDKFVITGICCFVLILLYNGFLIQRDEQLIKSYDQSIQKQQ